MITQDEFIKLISDNINHNNRVDEVDSVLKSNVFEWDIVEYGNILFDYTLELLFDSDAIDDIYWWLYSKSVYPELKMWDENGKEIPTETIEDLWNIVKNYRK